MKIVYYIIHNTHTIEHIERSLNSLKNQGANLVWDKLVIKNSIPNQINNELVKTIIQSLNVTNTFLAIEFVEPGVINTTYNDLKTAVEYGKANNTNFLLFTKAEYCYSINSFRVFNTLFCKPNSNWVFTPPIVNATELATPVEIVNYLNRNDFTVQDDLTGYDGDDHHRLTNISTFQKFINKVLLKLKLKSSTVLISQDLGNRKVDESKTYKFISHNVLLDINVHLFTNASLNLMNFNSDELNLQWGRIRTLDRLLEHGTQFIINQNCFAVHQFHEIPGARLGRNIKGIRY